MISTLLIADDAFDLLANAEQQGWAPSATQIEAFAREQANATQRTARAAGTVTIPVVGLLTPQPSLMAMLTLGSFTVYSRLQDAIRDADADPTVSSIVLDFDTPGGHAHGLFETVATIEAAKTPITARVRNAQSAGYALAAATNRIEATGPASMVGSIGVAASYMTSDRVVTLTSTNAPDKRPDLKTEEGRAVVRRLLDSIHGLFVEAIAKGRGTTPAKVNADYGKGATLLARDALGRGMVDAISGTSTGQAAGVKADAPITFEQTLAMIRGVGAKTKTPPTTADLGAVVVERMLATRAGTLPKQPAPVPIAQAPKPAAPPTRSDLGDVVADALAQRRSTGKQTEAPEDDGELATPVNGSFGAGR